MRLIHSTTHIAAVEILRNGFVDSWHRNDGGLGVYLCDEPLPELHGSDTTLLSVDVPDVELVQFELPSEIGYRRWLIPAAVLNRLTGCQLGGDG